jgi:hypothetical protein
MLTVNAADVLRLDSVDDYLGTAASRFFGAGYRRVKYTMQDVAVNGCADDHRCLRSHVAVVYPADWSRKKAAIDLRPHLSTLDVLILAVRLAELHLNLDLAMSRQQRRTAWLRRVDIKAGATPYEDGLDALRVHAVHRGTADRPDTRLGQVSTFDCEVGNMTVRCEIEHEPRTAPGAGPPLADLVDTLPGRLYGDGYQTRTQALKDIDVDIPNLRASATASVYCGQSIDGREDGLEAHYHPSVSMIDSFVMALQLGQILLYELDQFPRADSETLWMRNTTIVCDRPDRPAGSPFALTTALVEPRGVEARGAMWRTATIVGESPGLRTRCAVVHRLPGSALR